MEHAKKMILVDPKFYRPTILEKAQNSLDDIISSILNSDLPDDVKAKRYAEAARRFSVIKQLDPEPSTTSSTGKMTDSEVLESIAPAARYKAKRILDYLKRDGNMHFKDSGEVVFKNETIQDSNIVDLLDSAVIKKGVEKPAGFVEFAGALRDLHAPESLIINDDLRKLINPPIQKPRKSRAAAPSARKSSSTSPAVGLVRPKRSSKKSKKLSDFVAINWANY